MNSENPLPHTIDNPWELGKFLALAMLNDVCKYIGYSTKECDTR